MYNLIYNLFSPRPLRLSHSGSTRLRRREVAELETVL